MSALPPLLQFKTFASTCWLKCPDLPQLIFMKTVGGMANRQIARDVRAVPSTIDRLIARIGRHCMLLHIQLIAGVRPQGNLVLDGFESCERLVITPVLAHNRRHELKYAF
jgi:hypothetical protein